MCTGGLVRQRSVQERKCRRYLRTRVDLSTSGLFGDASGGPDCKDSRLRRVGCGSVAECSER
eukprot:1177292-Pyramimonas_sp.AAC.1